MGRVGTKFWPVVGIVAFIALTLGGLGVAGAAVIFGLGAPHAFPSSPGIAAALFSVATLMVVGGLVLLRRSIRALSATQPSEKQREVRKPR